MRIDIVYDNNVFKKNHNLKPDWGFACLLQTKKETILFDTGAKGEILLSNMKNLNFDL